MWMNFEMGVIEEMFVFVEEIWLVYSCLVFECCEELIIEGGFDVVGQEQCICDVV